VLDWILQDTIAVQSCSRKIGLCRCAFFGLLALGFEFLLRSCNRTSKNRAHWTGSMPPYRGVEDSENGGGTLALPRWLRVLKLCAAAVENAL
jgi:hypothetical protein